MSSAGRFAISSMSASREIPPLLHPRPLPARGLVLGALVILAAGSMASLLLFEFDPAHNDFYPRCFLYHHTGLLCPGCGGLRALHQLAHGYLLAALHFNALLVLSLPVAGVLALRQALAWFKGPSRPASLSPRWIYAWLTLALLFGLLRNFPFAHQLWLAP
jgi:hypothetical protein